MKFVTLMVITSAQYEDTLKEIAKEAGANGATIMQARGNGSGVKKLFSLTFEGKSNCYYLCWKRSYQKKF